MTVTTTGRAAYRGGASHTGYLAGFETANKLTRVLRYTFMTPADGVSKLSFTGAKLVRYHVADVARKRGRRLRELRDADDHRQRQGLRHLRGGSDGQPPREHGSLHIYISQQRELLFMEFCKRRKPEHNDDGGQLDDRGDNADGRDAGDTDGEP